MVIYSTSVLFEGSVPFQYRFSSQVMMASHQTIVCSYSYKLSRNTQCGFILFLLLCGGFVAPACLSVFLYFVSWITKSYQWKVSLYSFLIPNTKLYLHFGVPDLKKLLQAHWFTTNYNELTLFTQIFTMLLKNQDRRNCGISSLSFSRSSSHVGYDKTENCIFVSLVLLIPPNSISCTWQ